MNVLVTGGAGFIGSHFIKRLLELTEVEKVINLDCLSYGINSFCLEPYLADKRYIFIKGNILNEELLDYIFKKYNIDKVIHFAAESSVDKSLVNLEVFFRTNILGTQVLFERARKAWCLNNLKGTYSYKKDVKFLYISTDEVYGPIKRSLMRFTEEAPLRPTNPYATSKASGDLIALMYSKNFGFPVNITRSINNYGNYQFPDKLIPRMIIKGLRDERLSVYGKGAEVREWLHVKDHVDILLDILTVKNNGEIYNIASGVRKKNIEVVKLIATILGLPKTRITFVKNRLCHDKAYGINDRKLNEHFSFKPKRNFQSELEKIISWYSRNEEWWSKFI